MKQAFTDVVGNSSLKKKLTDEILQKKLSHAYILEGAWGTGKHMLALRIAAALACERGDQDAHPFPCMTCPACRKILAGNSPDIIYINRKEKATLGVEEIRGLKSDVYIPPNDLEVKIYIVEEAHLMTSQAQNAFLLTLEEPPAYVLFLLLCESTATLLETVKSRAPTLRTEPIPQEEMLRHLLDTNEEAKTLQKATSHELNEILAASDGSIGKALALLDPATRKPILAKRDTAREFVRLVTESQNSASTLRFIKNLGIKRDELISGLQMIRLCLRDLLLLKQTEGAPLCFFADREEALGFSDSFTTPELLRLCDELENACDKLRMNANVRLTLTSLAVSVGLLQ